mmetsp:Transcript_27677/g.89053  ORF Transcript_27677/g.89053 Transcript_27677/m.89053 type:complete len:201 (+) Transcript_27677:896-1498(+)
MAEGSRDQWRDLSREGRPRGGGARRRRRRRRRRHCRRPPAPLRCRPRRRRDPLHHPPPPLPLPLPAVLVGAARPMGTCAASAACPRRAMCAPRCPDWSALESKWTCTSRRGPCATRQARHTRSAARRRVYRPAATRGTRSWASASSQSRDEAAGDSAAELSARGCGHSGAPHCCVARSPPPPLAVPRVACFPLLRWPLGG